MDTNEVILRLNPMGVRCGVLTDTDEVVIFFITSLVSVEVLKIHFDEIHNFC